VIDGFADGVDDGEELIGEGEMGGCGDAEGGELLGEPGGVGVEGLAGDEFIADGEDEGVHRFPFQDVRFKRLYTEINMEDGQMEYASGWRAWVPRVALGVVIVIMVGVAAMGPLGRESEEIAPGAFVVQRVAWIVIQLMLPLWMIAALLLASKSRRKLAKVAITLSMVILVTITLGMSSTRYVALLSYLPGWFRTNVYVPGVYFFPDIAVPIVLICVARLRGRGWIIQAVAVVALVILMWLHATLPTSATIASGDHPLQAVGCAVCAIGAFIMGGWVAWMTWFRQATGDGIAREGVQRVALTCPRCGGHQGVAVGEDTCKGCQLKIFIRLAE
jgi:hypothetical protein